MAVNDFLIYSNGFGANIEPQSTYIIDPTVATGVESGIALSALSNKVWRQGSTGTALIGQLISDILSVDATDDGTLTYHLPNFATVLRTIGYAQDTSTIANVMAVTLTDGPLALQTGMVINLIPAFTNTTSVTLNLNGLGAKQVVTNAGILTGGELLSGTSNALMYNGTSWVILNYQTTCTTQSSSDSSTKLANTQFIQLNYAPLISPALTGIPTAPTAAPGTSTTQLATTAFAQSAGFPSGTRLIFDQPSAPVGWTRDISDRANNRMIVLNSSTTFTATGGTNSPILNNVVPAHTHNITTGSESAQHTHVDAGHTHTVPYFGALTGTAGANPIWANVSSTTSAIGHANLGTESVDHTHSGTTDAGSSQQNWTPRYLYTIVCQKN